MRCTTFVFAWNLRLIEDFLFIYKDADSARSHLPGSEVGRSQDELTALVGFADRIIIINLHGVHNFRFAGLCQAVVVVGPVARSNIFVAFKGMLPVVMFFFSFPVITRDYIFTEAKRLKGRRR